MPKDFDQILSNKSQYTDFANTSNSKDPNIYLNEPVFLEIGKLKNKLFFLIN